MGLHGTPRVWTDGVGCVRAGRCDAVEQGVARTALGRVRGDEHSSGPTQMELPSIEMNAGVTGNLARWSAEGRRGRRLAQVTVEQ